MARARTDGKRSATAVRVGKPRPTATGGTWRVRAYKPTSGAEYGRVVWRRPDTGRPTSAVPAQGQSLDEVFDQIEKALDGQVAIGTTTSATAESAPTRRDIRALGDLYIAWLELLNRNEDYVDNRRSLQRKWIYPVIGTVLVRDWSVEHSETVLAHARKSGLGPARVEDLGSTLSGMRAAAQRKREGGRWLSKEDNPLEEVSYSRAATIQGAGRNYVMGGRRRPRRHHLDPGRHRHADHERGYNYPQARTADPRRRACRRQDRDRRKTPREACPTHGRVHETPIPGVRRQEQDQGEGNRVSARDLRRAALCQSSGYVP